MNPETPQQAYEIEREESFKHTQEFHGCFTGDCPHSKQAECDNDFFNLGADWSHERSRKELEELKSQQFTLRNRALEAESQKKEIWIRSEQQHQEIQALRGELKLAQDDFHSLDLYAMSSQDDGELINDMLNLVRRSKTRLAAFKKTWNIT